MAYAGGAGQCVALTLPLRLDTSSLSCMFESCPFHHKEKEKMPTPQELRKISEAASKVKDLQSTDDSAKLVEQQAKQKAELLIANQEKARVAIAHAEANMMAVAQEGISAALVYLIESHEVAEAELRSLHSGAKIDSPDRYFCQGASKIVFDYFKDKEYNVVIVRHDGPRDVEGNPSKLYYVKVGW